MQDKTNMPNEKKQGGEGGSQWPETGKQGGQGQGDVGKKGGDLGGDQGRKDIGEDQGKSGDVTKP